MNAKEQKLKALADARRRATLNVRATSSASTTNAQSEVAESPPTVYQVPNINVPENLEEAAKLIQSELQKIAQSQSVLLTLWEKLKSQYATATGVEFTKPVSFQDSPQIEGQYGWNCIPERTQTVSDSMNNAPWGWSCVAGLEGLPDGVGYGTVLTISSGGTSGYATPDSQRVAGYNGAWLQQIYINTSAVMYIRQSTNGNAWSEWSAIQSDIAVKREIYAELQKLNAGLIVPIVINPE
ncbi:hypothetical protein DQD37_01870 [Salmonella enterica subsp. enterica serovar Cardoner]|uniref:Uncharacterized protein n=1 Tax=Salmonella enterica subsp. enterica serovar Cardoner TaxID=2564309 RepID=A0A5V6PT93_SALET|nr:hypothetical protein [Salmonella enterica subsp. enterica serovar Cardoner]EBW7241897.1 hypothetical protein [Salmonella enterica subsp. enterica serovar Cardoner]EBY8534633.1 hypothetical protein [Salmonella enterica subsp. enterica serovar Telelkebir]EHA9093050.1 hypothetical protein [Salmonella enterica subsp. enterica serovar Telelkebir]